MLFNRSKYSIVNLCEIPFRSSFFISPNDLVYMTPYILNHSNMIEDLINDNVIKEKSSISLVKNGWIKGSTFIDIKNNKIVCVDYKCEKMKSKLIKKFLDKFDEVCMYKICSKKYEVFK